MPVWILYVRISIAATQSPDPRRLLPSPLLGTPLEMDETTKKSVDYGLSSYQDEDEGVVSEVRLKVSSQIFVPEANVLIFLILFCSGIILL